MAVENLAHPPGVCPHCGRCPHCGQVASPFAPPFGWPAPWFAPRVPPNPFAPIVQPYVGDAPGWINDRVICGGTVS